MVLFESIINCPWQQMDSSQLGGLMGIYVDHLDVNFQQLFVLKPKYFFLNEAITKNGCWVYIETFLGVYVCLWGWGWLARNLDLVASLKAVYLLSTHPAVSRKVPFTFLSTPMSSLYVKDCKVYIYTDTVLVFFFASPNLNLVVN